MKKKCSIHVRRSILLKLIPKQSSMLYNIKVGPCTRWAPGRERITDHGVILHLYLTLGRVRSDQICRHLQYNSCCPKEQYGNVPLVSISILIWMWSKNFDYVIFVLKKKLQIIGRRHNEERRDEMSDSVLGDITNGYFYRCADNKQPHPPEHRGGRHCSSVFCL